nr:hypothetical protein [Tanacetum cinerariifolium]
MCDPGNYVLPVKINGIVEMVALVDTGASVSVLPYSLYKDLGLGDPRPYETNLIMANNNQAKAMGEVKNVRIQIRYQAYVVDLLVLDIPVDPELPLLLGRPLLRTCSAIIDMGRGTLYIDDGVIRHTYFPKLRSKSYVKTFKIEGEDDWLGNFEMGRDHDGNAKYGLVASSFWISRMIWKGHKIVQAMEIIKLEKRVKKLEKQRRSKSSRLKRLRKGRKDEDNAAVKDASAAEPTVFVDEEVTMTMAQTLIKMKAERARILDEQMAKRLHDEEVEQAAAREKQEKDDLEKAKVLQKQYVDKQENIDWDVVVEQMQEKHLDNIRKYQSLKMKPISIAQAKKNMIVYLKNMAGYKIEHFKGMTYEKVRPIFEREYNKVQTLFMPNKDVVEEPTKKRVAKETLLQESFKKLKAVKVSGSHSTQDTLIDDPKEMSEEDVKNMLEIILVSEFKVEALQVKYPLIDWEIHSEGSRSY